MFNRIDKHLVITTNNLMAMEAITQWIYRIIPGTQYCIEVELFPHTRLYHIYIVAHADRDNKIIKLITEELEARHISLMKEL